MQPSPLIFDSTLFGYPVAKIQIQKNWDEKVFLTVANKYQLVYIFSEIPLAITDSSILLVDTKLTYSKSVSKSNEAPSAIAQYRGEMNESLLSLALDSGLYSRFKIDPRLTQNEFQELYKLWIKKAWESNAILEAPKLQGMVSYSLEEKVANIGLIAVAKESQGQGWGKKLMKAAEEKASSLGAETISVITQEANLPACRLYESLGYKIAEKTYVYHWWKLG